MTEFDLNAFVYQALDQVLSEKKIAPGTRGAVFRAIDELRRSAAPRDDIQRAESIAVELHRLQAALVRSDEEGAEIILLRLRTLTDEWKESAVIG